MKMEAAVIDSKDRGETKAAVGEVSCVGEKGWMFGPAGLEKCSRDGIVSNCFNI